MLTLLYNYYNWISSVAKGLNLIHHLFCLWYSSLFMVFLQLKYQIKPIVIHMADSI